MKKLLVVVDIQNDFVDGALGTKEAVAIIPNVVKKIKEWDGDILCTQDTHFSDYLKTNEGKHLPVEHCIAGSVGHCINDDVFKVIADSAEHNNIKILNKYTFGSTALPEMIRHANYDYIELIGLCTDICVVSNALILKANFPETDIAVDARCCAGVTPETHRAALTTMIMCQIEVIGE